MLLGYRKHPGSVSQTHASVQVENSNRVRTKLLNLLGIMPSATELEIHRSFTPPDTMNTEAFLEQIQNWFIKILAANKEIKVYSQVSLEKVLSRRWLDVCSANTGFGLRIWKKFRESPGIGKITLRNGGGILKFFIKCLYGKK